MALFSRTNGTSPKGALPDFHPATSIRDWGGDRAFRISDALTGAAVFGATGSGKTSGAAKHLALGYLAAEFGGLVLCAKKEERLQWVEWARLAGRSDDLVIFEAGGPWTFNFLDWEATRAGLGGGLTMNIVALLDEIASALGGGAGTAEGGGDNKFFEDALHHMNMNLVDLPTFAGMNLPRRLRAALRSLQAWARTCKPASPGANNAAPKPARRQKHDRPMLQLQLQLQPLKPQRYPETAGLQPSKAPPSGPQRSTCSKRRNLLLMPHRPARSPNRSRLLPLLGKKRQKGKEPSATSWASPSASPWPSVRCLCPR